MRDVDLRPIHEPATLVARPSLLWWTRVAWLVAAAVLSAAWLPRIEPWAPVLVVPVIVSAAAAASHDAWFAALGWAVAGGILLDLTPPHASVIGLSALGYAVGAFVAARGVRWWTTAPWVPCLIGFACDLAVRLTGVAVHAAASGSLILRPLEELIGAVLTGLLTGLVAPRWTRWALAQHERGRA